MGALMSTADLWLLLLSILLVVLGGLLVAAETAIARVSRGRIEDLRREDRRA